MGSRDPIRTNDASFQRQGREARQNGRRVPQRADPIPSRLAPGPAVPVPSFRNMNLATLLIPPSTGAKQALRLRRLGLAALSYALAAALAALACTFGELPLADTLTAVAAFVAINLGLYLFIRTGLNLRFEDPSLTRFQMLAAITVLMWVVYHMDDGRGVALFACFLVFLFGIYRLNAREFTVISLYTLAAYALVINLLMHLRPYAIHSVQLEWMSWLLLAGFLPSFAVLGGQINTLRRRLRTSEARLRSLIEMSSDFYWESDREHRLTLLSAGGRARPVPALHQDALIGKRRWEMPRSRLAGAPGAARRPPAVPRLRVFAPWRGWRRAAYFDQRGTGIRQHRRVRRLSRRGHRHQRAQAVRTGPARQRR
jgi:PAS domain-containing protein